MRNLSILLLTVPAVLLTGCGGTPAEEPVEQIIVREPGVSERLTVEGEGSAEKGEAAFAVCAGCHSVERGAPVGPGPNLHSIVGKKAGSAEGFGFSEALASSGITWTEAELDSFIADPTAKVPGTTMVAGAVSDPEARKAIVAYLASNAE